MSSKTQDEDVWDCIISAVTDCLEELPLGNCVIEILDYEKSEDK